MGEAKRQIGPMAQLPSRAAIGEALLAEEGALVEALIAKARFGAEDRRTIETLALSLVKAAREGRAESGGVDAFMHEYGLSSEEGVLLMCLAEALLRIPDAATADRLIADKIVGRRLGEASRPFGLAVRQRLDLGADADRAHRQAGASGDRRDLAGMRASAWSRGRASR